jgi:hypothetical protein
MVFYIVLNRLFPEHKPDGAWFDGPNLAQLLILPPN